MSSNDLGDERHEKVNTPPFVQAPRSIKHKGLCEEWAPPLLPPNFRAEPLRHRLFTLICKVVHTHIHLLCIPHLVVVE